MLDGLALESMLLPALEGYLSPRKAKRKGYEVYGVNFGMSRQFQRHGRDGLKTTRIVSVTLRSRSYRPMARMALSSPTR